MNLVSNAQRYGSKIEVHFRVNEADQQAVIIIDDDGPGIEIKKREDVFKPFFRLETSRNKKTGGVGLGLSIAQDVVLSHGGSITLDDSPLGGLRVQIMLPL